jgi:large subunit ribosomal protein L15
MNVGELDQIANGLLLKGHATREEEGIFIDLNSLGVDKLLGSGKVNRKLIVRVKTFSTSADRKIREAKGNIINVE